MQPTERFSSRVEDYVKYRPSYPAEIVAVLTSAHGLTPQSVVADIGAGTGLLSELFLRNGNPVYAVEPNAAMRAAGVEQLAAYPHCTSIAGSAEATTLPAASVDLVSAGQAFHWFDQAAAAREFSRILRPNGRVALVWNDRRSQDTPFAIAYERLLHEYGTDYSAVNHNRFSPTDILGFFAPDARRYTFANRQVFDLDGLIGRVRSSSYTPPPGHPRHEPMLAALRRLFAEHASADRVAFNYDTTLYVGGVVGCSQV